MAPNSNEKPLTAVESVQDRRESMPVSPALKEALKPGKKITLSDPTINALLNGRQDLVIKFDAEDQWKLSGTLSDQLARELFESESGYNGLTADQRYFVVTLESILTKDKINPSMANVGDTFTFRFGSGTYSMDRKGDGINVVTGDLKIDRNVNIQGVAKKDLADLINQLEDAGLLVQALQQFEENPTVQGRVGIIEREQAGFINLINFYLPEGVKELDGGAKNYGYMPQNPAHNIAFLKAYLRMQRYRNFGDALPKDIFLNEPSDGEATEEKSADLSEQLKNLKGDKINDGWGAQTIEVQEDDWDKAWREQGEPIVDEIRKLPGVKGVKVEEPEKQANGSRWVTVDMPDGDIELHIVATKKSYILQKAAEGGHYNSLIGFDVKYRRITLEDTRQGGTPDKPGLLYTDQGFDSTLPGFKAPLSPVGGLNTLKVYLEDKVDTSDEDKVSMAKEAMSDWLARLPKIPGVNHLISFNAQPDGSVKVLVVQDPKGRGRFSYGLTIDPNGEITGPGGSQGLELALKAVEGQMELGNLNRKIDGVARRDRNKIQLIPIQNGTGQWTEGEEQNSPRGEVAFGALEALQNGDLSVDDLSQYLPEGDYTLTLPGSAGGMVDYPLRVERDEVAIASNDL